jgi:predicted nuclease of restriction endonuclease-like RecB superfamily
MLTGDLLRVRTRGATLVPSYINPTKPGLMEDAEALLAIFQLAVSQGATRERVDGDIGAIVAGRRDHRLLKGLAKLLFDRSELDIRSPVPPAELRARVFRAAREAGPLALDTNVFGRPTADGVLAAVGDELGLDADEVRAALYADRNEERRFIACKVPDAGWLLHRYNVALVQAALLRAVSVQITLSAPSGPRIRQLLRYAKFHQLIHTTARVATGLQITLDGPTSLLRQSTRYGLQLANFFPAVLLQDGAWSLEATVLWTKAGHRKTLRVASGDGLVSHYRDSGAYTTREQTWFAERWAALDTRWKMTDQTDPIDLGGRGVVLPDFSFKRGRKVGHLEIIGYWRPETLQTRLDMLQRYGPGTVILAVSRKLRGSKQALDAYPGEVVEFAEIVPPKKVLEALERL